MDIPSVSEIVKHLSDQYVNNQFTQAAVVASILGGLIVYCKQVPGNIWKFICRMTTIEVSFNSDIPAYDEIADVITKTIVNETFSRRYNFDAKETWDRTHEQHVVNSRDLQVGYGRHWGVFRGTFVIVNRHLEEGNQTANFKERMEVTFVSRRRKVMKAFARMLRDEIGRAGREDVVNIFLNKGDYWSKSSKLPMRSLSTVITANNVGKKLVDHVRKFEEEKPRYRKLGLPWHTGAILKGPPGTGKTSLIHAVASELERSIHYLNLGALDGDAELTSLMAGTTDWTRTLLVIEDADATGISGGRKKKVSKSENSSDVEEKPAEPVTLSTLLNVLDGLMTPDGLVVLATTNHPENLDPAMMRSGRFDLDIMIEPLQWPQFVEMAELFEETDGIETLQEIYQPTPGANLRAMLLEGGLPSVSRHFSGVTN